MLATGGGAGGATGLVAVDEHAAAKAMTEAINAARNVFIETPFKAIGGGLILAISISDLRFLDGVALFS
jgi:hypothetical protein